MDAVPPLPGNLAPTPAIRNMARDAMVIEPITADPQVQRLLSAVRRPGKGDRYVTASGLWGSSAPMLAALALDASDRPILYLTAHLEQADHALDDLEFFSDGRGVLFPAWEARPGEGAGAGEIDAERQRICLRLHDPTSAGQEAPRLIVLPIQALMQAVPTPRDLDASTYRLCVGERHDPEQLIAWLIDQGYQRLDLVESPGDFARRGDILDVFVPGEADPARIEFLDDGVESLRTFDVSTRRSITTCRAMSLLTATCRSIITTAPDTLLGYLPDETLVVFQEPADIQEMGQTLERRLMPTPGMFAAGEVLERLGAFEQLHLSRLPADDAGGPHHFRFRVSSLSRFEVPGEEAIPSLCQAAAEGPVHVICDNEGERSRLHELIVEHAGAVPPALHTSIGMLHRGFEWTACRTVVLPHHELFHRYHQRRRLRRVPATQPLETWMDLEPGVIVVHTLHGIARFESLKTIRKSGTDKTEEFLTLKFADDAVLHVPTSQIDLVNKYVGAGPVQPQLSRLGGSRWRKTTERVGEAVTDLAAALLNTQAQRDQEEGTAFPADTDWQREFEASFIYEETEDQLTVGQEIKTDLCRARPMDRLLCGDVGYGKTELAVRAAFKVAEYGRQVAVLVPTTVLAEQHYRTFCERLADYPFIIGCLSRFRTAGEQKELTEAARRGQVDVLIGTHRLLSKDVAFANLGLVVIDEEQRFGVEHKEKLRQLRATVEVLTMTATPIPRTLHMAMLGLRDISALATPPIDRRAIATEVRPYSAELIREAILREMNRDGQVYFVHNLVQSIHRVADDVRKIVPEARVCVGHGQMAEGELQRVMTAFIRHQADVLVATTIIESGIDIPNVNTIFIDRANRFGLADLHQLRGRVGRAQHRAYCYLLLPRGETVTPQAAKRLKSLEEFSELGAGFRIAMRDLEIRGAGNILGAEQSGHIGAVGYEMYCRLLEQAVRRLRDEPAPLPPTVHLELGVAAHLPAAYVSATRSRIDIYRRLVSALNIEELRQLDHDLVDAFGRYPPAVARLLELAEIRVRAGAWGIRSIVLHGPDLVFTVDDHRRVAALFAAAAGTARLPDARTIHWRPPSGYLEPPTIVPVLRRMLAHEEPARA